MPQLIEVPGMGDVEFPDGMSDDAIATAIRQNSEPSTTSKIVGTIPKAAYALNRGVENSVADLGAGVSRLSDPGPLPNSLRQHTRAMIRAGDLGYDVTPIDPITLQPRGLDPLTRAIAQLGKEREQQRIQLRAPGVALEQSARESGAEFGQMEDATPGSTRVAKGAEMVGGMLPLVAEAAVPVVGPAAAIATGGVQTTGSVFNQAHDYYLKQGYSEEDAKQLADDVALKAGAANAMLFAALPGPGNAVAKRILGDRLAARPIAQALARTGLAGTQAGAVMAADTATRNLQATGTYRPALTAGEALKEAGTAFVTGAVTGGIIHGAGELARMPKVNREADSLEADLNTEPARSPMEEPGVIPPERRLRNAPIITPEPGLNRTLNDTEALLRDLPELPPEERMTPVERLQTVRSALDERQPIPVALVDRINQDRDVPLALPEGYTQEGDQFQFTEPSKRLTPKQLMVRENQAAMAGLREQPPPAEAPPETPASPPAITALDPLPKKLIPVDVTAAAIKASKTRLSKRSPGNEKRVIADEEARRNEFERAAFNETPGQSEPMPVEQLFVGDKFKVNGNPVRVREWVTDVDTGQPAGVKLSGAYGDQFVPTGQTIHLEKGSLEIHKPDFLDRADAALGERATSILKEGRTNFLGDPELGVVAIARGAVKIAKGVRDFAQWSAEMLKEFGETIQPHLQEIWNQSKQVVNGDHPTIGLSERGIKMAGNEDLASGVQDAINPLYTKRSNETDVDLARRLIGDAGGAQAAAQGWSKGQFRDAPGSVQTILGGEIQRGLANQERVLRGSGKTAEADAIVQQQIKLAQADIARATDTAQALQAFQAHYANWSPAAWLTNFRKNITRVAAERVSRVAGEEVSAEPAAISKAIANQVADALEAQQPKLAKTIRTVFGEGEAAPVEVKLERAGVVKDNVKATAKKLEDFYKREVAKWRSRHNVPEFNAETERDIVRRANDLEKLPTDSIQRREAAQSLFTHLQRLKGFEWWELPMDFWYANVLSGLSTHAKNVLGNAVNLGSETAVQMLRNPTAIPQILEALGRALPKSLREAGNIMRTGHDNAGRHGDKFEAAGILERVENPVTSKVLLPWKLVGRFLKAEDVGFFYPLQEVKGVVQARSQAAAEGLPILGGKRAQRARSIMAWTAEARSKAEAQAAQEGLSGNTRARRVAELLEQSRPPQLMENARDFAFLGTFNNDPYGVLGTLTDAWGNAAQVPALKLVIPFTRIVSNLSNSMLNWTPVGAYRAARAQGYKLLIGRADNTGKLFGKAVTDPGAIGDQYARATLGTIALGTIAAAAGQYVLDPDPRFLVTAQGPADADQRRLLQQAGWIPYSIKVGPRYYSFQDKPLALPLSIVGHYLDAVRYRKLDQQDALNRSTYAVGAAGNVILNSSWLQGLSSLFDQANRDSVRNPLKALPSQALKTASSFVVPNAVRQIDQLFDATKYTADDVRSMLLRETPFARRENMPDLNVFGQPIHAPMSKMFWSKVEGDPVTQILAGRRLWPSVPVEGELTAAEQYQLMRYRGPILKSALTERLAEIQTLPHAEAQDLVSSISRRVTRDAKKTLGLDEVSQMRTKVRDMKER